jgi:hypothetical protein
MTRSIFVAQDEVFNQLMDEIGLDLSAKLTTAPKGGRIAAAQQEADGNLVLPSVPAN